jgi:hypothetical protein
VSLKELNLLKRNSELTGVSGKLIMSIDNPIYSEEDEMDLTPTRKN